MLAPGNYGYFIQAVNAGGAVSQSNKAIVKIEAPVVTPEYISLTGALDSSKTIQLQWTTPVSGSVAMYYLYRYYMVTIDGSLRHADVSR